MSARESITSKCNRGAKERTDQNEYELHVGRLARQLRRDSGLSLNQQWPEELIQQTERVGDDRMWRTTGRCRAACPVDLSSSAGHRLAAVPAVGQDRRSRDQCQNHR